MRENRLDARKIRKLVARGGFDEWKLRMKGILREKGLKVDFFNPN